MHVTFQEQTTGDRYNQHATDQVCVTPPTNLYIALGMNVFLVYYSGSKNVSELAQHVRHCWACTT